MQEWYILGVGKGVLFREVSSVQRCPYKFELNVCVAVNVQREGCVRRRKLLGAAGSRTGP